MLTLSLIACSLGELDDVDYLLRAEILKGFEFKAESTSCPDCAAKYSARLALCHKLGFGGPRNEERSRYWFSRSRLTQPEMDNVIRDIKTNYRHTGRLPEQVKDSIAIGVIVTIDRVEQYQTEGRLLDAQRALSIEVEGRTTELGHDHLSTSKLKSELARVLIALGRLKEAEFLQLEVIASRSKHFGEEHPSSLASLATLATILSDQGRLIEAEKIQRRVLPQFVKVLGEDHPETHVAMQHLGFTLYSQERMKEAEDVLRKVVDLRTKVLTENHPLTLKAIMSLSSTLQGQGRLKEAGDLMKKIEEMCNKVLGDDEKVIQGHMRLNQAILLKNQGFLDEADKIAKKVVDSFSRVYDKDDLVKLSSMDIRASVLGAKGQLDEEESLIREILVLKKPLGDNNPSVLDTQVRLAGCLLRRRMYDSAKEEATEVLQKLDNSLPADPDNFLAASYILASVSSLEGKIEEEQKLRKDLVKLCEDQLGEAHPWTIDSMFSLAECYAKHGLWREAEAFQEKILNLTKDPQRCDKDAIRAAQGLAFTYREQARFQESEKMSKDAISWCREIYGDKHLETKMATNSLAGTYIRLGRIDEAEEMLNSISEPIQEGARNNTLTIYILDNMAELSISKNDFPRAVEARRKVLELSTRVYGGEHPDTLKMAGNLLDMFLPDYLTDEIEAQVLENLRLKRKILGEQNPSTVKTMTNLAYAYTQNGRLPDAEKLFAEVDLIANEDTVQNALRFAIVCAKRADFYFTSEMYEQAQELEEKVLEIRRKYLGPEHNATLTVMSNLMTTLNMQKKYEDAEQLARHVMDARIKTLPPNDIKISKAKADLAGILFYRGDLTNAQTLYESTVECATRVLGRENPATKEWIKCLQRVQEERRHLPSEDSG
jgi:tetratricopeptide (TPR) repeat protein